MDMLNDIHMSNDLSGANPEEKRSVYGLFSIILPNSCHAIARILLLLGCLVFSFVASGQSNKKTGDDLSSSGSDRNPDQIVSIVALQAGTKYSEKGNPGSEANFTLFAKLARQAAVSQPRPTIICFPEYAISGWGYPSEKVMNGLAESIPGPGNWYQRYRNLAKEIGIPIIGWLVETADNKRYSTAFMIDGHGIFKGKYRKVHANLGEQTWWGWTQGEHFELMELNGIKYGISICSDMWFPETIRCLELMGADVVLHLSIGDDMQQVIPVRALDSRVPIVAAIFQGGSYAVDANGKLIDKLPAEEAAYKAFQIHPFKTDLGNKYGGKWNIKKGQQNLRNINAYSMLLNPSTRPPWTAVFMDNHGGPQTRQQLLQRFEGRYDPHDPQPIKKSQKKPIPVHSKTQLSIQGNQFTINRKPTFLYGISYYGALGAPTDFIRKDLADIKKNGFNWIRIWANWTGFDADISAVDDQGNPRKAFLDKLLWIVKACDRKGIVVDVTLSRSNGLNDTEAHLNAVKTLVTALQPYRNWYLDLANERDIQDDRFVGFEELKRLRETAHKLDTGLLITASAGNDISLKDLKEYLHTVGVDFISPHRPREAGSPAETETKTLAYLARMKDLGQIVPINYQEPFRRGYTQWQPTAEDYIKDLFGAKAGGAAGWCFHNGDQRGGKDGVPRRSFDLREKRLFDQLDTEELYTIKSIKKRDAITNK